jgi:hypothetical protein
VDLEVVGSSPTSRPLPRKLKPVLSLQRFRKRKTMPEEQRTANNSQTYVVDADEFTFETIEGENGQATVIRFKLADPSYQAGDVLLVLSESEIHFHGMIASMADGWATASDKRGSLLPAMVQ